ncbi:MAG: CarD family transcriptional regulator [Vicinamibacterales bacterium]|mgnify:FL=1|jgi:CarD family transcriptional regulator|nr:CarD family transcriptional regulator [Vicinamibacterales bacterium]HJO18054.1 CarD family transcriptional regulator [Vicinamibacterales bacterium]|tara:strand:- start:7749 stop:8390 length:642 start_codon:yes stop_codon:yes gene_type:complete
MHSGKKSKLGGDVAFDVGDKVIYPNHGLGVVEAIEDKTIMGTTCGFYQLRMVSSDTTVLVPVGNIESVGLRRAVSDDEIDRLYRRLANGKIDNHQNWKGRFKDNSDKMRSGSIEDAIEVLKNLTFLSKSKSLSFREKRMLDKAKFFVVSEIAEVSNEPVKSVDERVDKSLERCFASKARAAAAAASRAKKTTKTAKASTRSSSRRTSRAVRAS